MTRIGAVHAVLPPHRYEQYEITEALAGMAAGAGGGRGVVERVHAAAGVRSRRLALPLEQYARLGDFGEANDRFIEAAQDLGEEAVRGALDAAGIAPDEVDLVISTSVTGIAAPSIEARLAGRLGLRPDVRRLPVFGLGCAGGAAGLARLHDYLEPRPQGVAVLLSVELCSLTLQRADPSTANAVAGALFGDGAAAVVAVGRDRAAAGPEVVAARSRLYPGTERLLGWDIGAGGFRIVLGGELPDLVRDHLGPEVEDFLAGHGLKTGDVTGWICHPGGPKVLEAVREALDLPARALEPAWRSLAEVGNLSSASVLHILRDVLAGERPLPGSPGLLLAMGPGFASELVLLRW
ncbi:type III polyketide synthase [Actinacidiphila epipremni]|uniref:Type III polyketide synthase n=1 Tax=Actinacidiphila epipremni TaxID=2053013 RepID=A0ABX0ZWN1_9ACTN|nr:3-oxoacyl-[acyl-carrier-protein] synthase III C-terminal domain-containing protein [Actinacidiphila epipremni]NJP47385.1 type III polyketide synthase [Actinacidiphila epipremni]